MEFGKAGLIVICKREKKVALIKGAISGKWGFPKGDVENGESLKQCAVREFKEETGHEIESIVHDLSLKVKGNPNRIYFLSIVEQKFNMVYQRSEISEAKWVDLKSIRNTDKNYVYDTRLLSKIMMGYSSIYEQNKLKKYIDYNVF